MISNFSPIYIDQLHNLIFGWGFHWAFQKSLGNDWKPNTFLIIFYSAAETENQTKGYRFARPQAQFYGLDSFLTRWNNQAVVRLPLVSNAYWAVWWHKYPPHHPNTTKCCTLHNAPYVNCFVQRNSKLLVAVCCHQELHCNSLDWSCFVKWS